MSPQEIEAAVAKIRDRVQERYRKTVEDLDGFTLPPLDPLGHARDAAEGKAAAIGRVNPRRGGPVNNAIQYAKRLVARCLNWFVRDQIDYNRAVVVYMDRVIETLIEQNYNLLRVARGVVDAQRSAAELNEGQQDIRRELTELNETLADAQRSIAELNEDRQDIRRELAELNETQRDMLKHWRNWRPEWEKRLTDNEIKFLHMLREIEGAARQREEAAQAAAAKMRQELTDSEIKFLHMLREIEDAARQREETAQAAAAKMRQELTDSEIKFLHMLREIEDAARQREETAQAATAKMRQELTDNEIKFEDAARRHEETAQAAAAKMHQEYSALLAQSTGALQKQFWADMERQRTEQEKSIHTELRLIRQRSSRTATATAPPPPAPAADGTAAAILPFDYGRFQERFRGSEEYVAKSQSQYLEICRGLAPIVDLGCGRGELLELFQAKGVECLGVDSDPDAAGACRDKGLNAEAGDLFEFLRRQEDGSLGAIFSAHVVEHLPPLRLPELVELAAAKLKPAGILALETPNPACLAIFSGDFYLDPTHRRPAPAQQLRFYMEESGLGGVKVRELNPAYETIPELTGLREDPAAGPFVEKFFGGLDYVIWGKKL